MNTNIENSLFTIDEAVKSFKDIWNLQELVEMDIPPQNNLWGPFFSKSGLQVLAGVPDGGKSMFCLNLSLSIAMKQDTFHDLPLNWKHGRTLFIETEDYHEEVAKRVKKQIASYKNAELDDSSFILLSPSLAGRESKEAFFIRVKKILTDKPVDLVVVSSLGDVFMGNDSNNNMQMRETASYFDGIAREFNTLVLLIHHVNKSAYDKNPSQGGIQGGSGLLQKVRLAASLNTGQDGIKYFSIVKGNQVPKSEKEKALVLEFDEDTFTFQNTGNRVPLDEIIQHSSKDRKVNEINWKEVFSKEKTRRRKDIVEHCQAEYGISRSLVDNNLKSALECGVLQKTGSGVYTYNG